MSVCLYLPNNSFRFKYFFYFLNFINEQIEIHNTKIIISKDYWKIDRNLKCKITTLSGSNIFLFFLILFSDR